MVTANTNRNSTKAAIRVEIATRTKNAGRGLEPAETISWTRARRSSETSIKNALGATSRNRHVSWLHYPVEIGPSIPVGPRVDAASSPLAPTLASLSVRGSGVSSRIRLKGGERAPGAWPRTSPGRPRDER